MGETGFGGGAYVRSGPDLPAAPVLTVLSPTEIIVSIGSDTNPDTVEYCLYDETRAAYIAADGTTSASEVYQTAAEWADTVISGLTAATEYTIKAKARNSTATAYSLFGPGAYVQSGPDLPAAPVLTVLSPTEIIVSIGSDTNPDTVEYCLYDETRAAYIAADGTTSASEVYQTAAEWADTVMSGLTEGTEYTIKAKARNSTATAYSLFGPGAVQESGAYVAAAATITVEETMWAYMKRYDMTGMIARY